MFYDNATAKVSSEPKNAIEQASDEEVRISETEWARGRLAFAAGPDGIVSM